MRGEVQSYSSWLATMRKQVCSMKPLTVLQRPVEDKLTFASTYPLVHYLLGYFNDSAAIGKPRLNITGMQPRCRRITLSLSERRNARSPFRNEGGPKRRAGAPYYLGNLLFDAQPETAISNWEQSRSLDPSFATVHRNLGWAYYRHQNEVVKAIDAYEKAIRCDAHDPRLFLELDSLYECANATPERRLCRA